MANPVSSSQDVKTETETDSKNAVPCEGNAVNSRSTWKFVSPAPLVSTAALHLHHHLHLLLFGLSLSYVCTPLTLRGWWME